MGTITLRGVLRSELEDHLTKELGRFIQNPIVQAEARMRISVLGEVGSPGFYTVPATMLVGEALMRAGGPGQNADLDDLYIERQESGDQRRIWEGDALQDAMAQGFTLDQMNLRAGDVIQLPQVPSRTIWSNVARFGLVLGTALIFGVRGLVLTSASAEGAPGGNEPPEGRPGMLRVLGVAGARPNFMKIGPVARALERTGAVEFRLVHTGQHYDERMSQVFFEELALPRPHVDLGVGSGSHTEQTARVMIAFEPICRDWQPDLVLVVGDVNSTVACALVAAKLGIPVAHVEAGLRSFDWSMPEEINRVVTDRLSRLLFTTEESANENLDREGVPAEHVHFVGNVMIDTLRAFEQEASRRAPMDSLGLEAGGYVLVTLHRPSNVDDEVALARILAALRPVAERHPVVFPMHPRTRKNVESYGLSDRLGDIRVLEPLGYLEFLGLMAQATMIVTDSGGIQEESTVLGVPCVTLRPNTERPVTITAGTNYLLPPDETDLESQLLTRLEAALVPQSPARAPVPPLWDGQAAERIAAAVVAFLQESADATS